MSCDIEIELCHLRDVKLIKYQDVYCDDRGFFHEAYNAESFKRMGIDRQWVQDNISFSNKGVLRGLHIQLENPQGKLVRCLSGHIRDVAVDLRPESKTFGQWAAFDLNGMEKNALWIPEGFAHGFYCHEDSLVYYKCTTTYDKSSDGGIIWNDEKLGIQWQDNSPIISKKDSELKTFEEICHQIQNTKNRTMSTN